MISSYNFCAERIFVILEVAKTDQEAYIEGQGFLVRIGRGQEESRSFSP